MVLFVMIACMAHARDESTNSVQPFSVGVSLEPYAGTSSSWSNIHQNYKTFLVFGVALGVDGWIGVSSHVGIGLAGSFDLVMFVLPYGHVDLVVPIRFGAVAIQPLAGIGFRDGIWPELGIRVGFGTKWMFFIQGAYGFTNESGGLAELGIGIRLGSEK